MKHISLQPHSAETCRKLYVKEHAKFIHSSYTIAEDLGKTVSINDLDYTIAGIWDIIGFKKNILLKEVGKETSYTYADSKIVAEALGFTNYRNLVTGEQVPYDMAAEFRIKKANKFKLEALEALEDINPIMEDTFESIDDEDDIITEDIEDAIIEDEEDTIIEDEDFEDEEVDPLVKALRQSDDNEDYYNDNENE